MRSPFLDLARHTFDLEAVALTHPQLAANIGEGPVEERLDMVGLEPGCLGAFHLAAHVVDLGVAHGRWHELVRPQQLGDAVGDLRVHHLGPGSAGASGLFASRMAAIIRSRSALPWKSLAEHVVDAPAECGALLLKLLQQPRVHVTLTRVVGDEGPHEAGIGLTDPVNPAEALLNAVRGSTAGRS